MQNRAGSPFFFACMTCIPGRSAPVCVLELALLNSAGVLTLPILLFLSFIGRYCGVGGLFLGFLWTPEQDRLWNRPRDVICGLDV